MRRGKPMKLSIKKLIVCLAIASIFFTSSLPVSASENKNEAVYSMEIGGTQSFTLQDASGNDVLVTITELPSTTRSLENRSYKVSYRSLLSWEAGYNVVIKNNLISSVNSPYYKCFVGSIFGSVLKKDSSTQATLSFIYKVSSINNSTGVRTNVVNNQLKVTVL